MESAHPGLPMSQENQTGAALDRREIKKGLRSLSPEIPWTHLINLNGILTISPREDEKSYRKAKGLLHFGEIALQLCNCVSRGQTIQGKNILDVGCGEGGHSLLFASNGAKKVTGIEGRDLTARRARFAAEALNISNAEFITSDIHALDPNEIGIFDIVLCSGILHHVDYDRWFDFLKKISALTIDTAIFYTHVADEQMAGDHKLEARLRPAEQAETRAEKRNGLYQRIKSTFGFQYTQKPIIEYDNFEDMAFEGYIFREHREESSPTERISKMRASLDNIQSFWATEETLVNALRKAGFSIIFKAQWPHMFGSQRSRNTRQIIVARKS